MNEINTSKIKISQLRALVAVAEYNNFSEAALHLEISQSAISHAIASLEEELGIVLITRGRHGAHFTPVGERITNHARKTLELLEAMVREANLERGLQGGNVRIACFRSVATHILPTVIARFRHYFPQITVTITEYDDFSGVEQALHQGYADIGFTYLATGNEFETWEILRDDYIVLIPPNTKLRNAKITWEELATYPLIISSINACNTRIRKGLSSLVSLNIAYEVREDSTIVSMVVQGLGVAILPRLAAEPVPSGVQVCSLPEPLERIIGVAILANALHVPAVYAFLDAIRNTGKFAVKTAV